MFIILKHLFLLWLGTDDTYIHNNDKVMISANLKYKTQGNAVSKYLTYNLKLKDDSHIDTKNMTFVIKSDNPNAFHKNNNSNNIIRIKGDLTKNPVTNYVNQSILLALFHSFVFDRYCPSDESVIVVSGTCILSCISFIFLPFA